MTDVAEAYATALDLGIVLRPCEWCRGEISATARRDAKFCTKRCRQAAHRFQRGHVVRRRAEEPLRLAYADPPYPGLAKRYYGDHPDFGGEVDHRELLERLGGYDGWALSTNSRSLPELLRLAGELGLEPRVAAWLRGARRVRSFHPLQAWEPVLYVSGRQDPDAPAEDALAYAARARRTDPGRVIGAKPAEFIWWVFSLLGARAGDRFDDLFPGSGGFTRAWSILDSRDELAAIGAR